MSRQIIVLTAALAVHTAAVVVVATSWDSPPPPAPVAAAAALPAPCQTGAPPPALRDRWAPAPVAAAGGITDADLEAGIHMSDATHGMIARALYDRLFADPMALGRSVRIVPATRDGHAAGFKLYAIRPGSLFDRMHFQNGDTLQTVNGVDLADNDKSLATYIAAHRTSSLEIGLLRKGSPLTIGVAIVGITPAFLDANIEYVDATHVRVSRAAIALALARDTELVSGARVVPSLRDNRAEGYKVYAIQPGSVAARLGLENGDTVLAVNHLGVADPAITLGRWTMLGTAPELDLAITRRGQPLTLTVIAGAD